MEEFKVEYQHGHFIELATRRRLIPVQGSLYTIIANPEDFNKEDAKLKMSSPVNSSKKSELLEKEYGQGNIKKILEAGEKLIFRIGNSRMVLGDESREYFFLAVLLEDLYLGKLKYRDGNKINDWRLADCKCELVSCIRGGLVLTEKIQAESLNKLFSQTVMFYFSMQRSGSANAFSTFLRYDPNSKIIGGDNLQLHFESLQRIRKKIIENEKR
jgi:hypothetical protein